MGFSEAVRTCLFEKYATFSGRAARSEYWYFYLFYVLVLIALVMLFLLFGGGGFSGLATDDLGSLPFIPLILSAVFLLGTLLPLISVTVRRFHDRNLSGWWYLASILAGMIPMVGLGASIAALVITILKGTPGQNRFGRDPLGADTNADVFA
jgi:uncharacterized membrane protein YhaH (DUF805 family)